MTCPSFDDLKQRRWTIIPESVPPAACTDSAGCILSFSGVESAVCVTCSNGHPYEVGSYDSDGECEWIAYEDNANPGKAYTITRRCTRPDTITCMPAPSNSGVTTGSWTANDSGVGGAG